MPPGKFSATKINITGKKSVEKETFRLTEALFADDTTLYGEMKCYMAKKLLKAA